MKFVFSTTLALALLTSAPALADGRIDVMTQNQYLGADLDPIIAAPDPAAFNVALVAALETISANDYPARAQKLAELIADRLPELVGLQEMFQFKCEDFFTQTPGFDCSYPPIANAFNDHLVETLSALDKLHESYGVAAIVNNLDLTGVLGIPAFDAAGLPVDLDMNGLPDIAVTVLDRDVILARDDIPAAAVPFNTICDQPANGFPMQDGTDLGPGCNYANILIVPTSLLDENENPIVIEVQRGFVGVDALVDGRIYRFVDTHLEVSSPLPEQAFPPSGPDDIPGGSIQAAQATELSALVAASLLFIPIKIDDRSGVPNPIIVGDINSGPMDEVFTDSLLVPGESGSSPPDLLPPYKQLETGQWLFGGQPPGMPPPPFLPALTDAWDGAPDDLPGFSCCQGISEEEGGDPGNLLNHQSNLVERIDVIFSLEEPSKVKKARVLGAKVSSKTLPPGHGLWPSDHGSVAAELQFVSEE
jgi:hypothetical protein